MMADAYINETEGVCYRDGIGGGGGAIMLIFQSINKGAQKASCCRSAHSFGTRRFSRIGRFFFPQDGRTKGKGEEFKAFGSLLMYICMCIHIYMCMQPPTISQPDGQAGKRIAFAIIII